MLNKQFKTITILGLLTLLIPINVNAESKLTLKDGKFNSLDYNIYAGKQTLDALSAEVENNKEESAEILMNLINYYCSSEEKIQRDAEDRQTLQYQLNKNSSTNKENFSKLSNSLKPPVNCNYIPTTYYGVALDKDKLDTCKDYKYLELSTPQGTKVLAQFAGTIDTIEENENTITIKVSSENNIKCIYSNIMSTTLKVGDTINQYDILGEQNKYCDNLYLRLEVLLEGKNINPSLLYK